MLLTIRELNFDFLNILMETYFETLIVRWKMSVFEIKSSLLKQKLPVYLRRTRIVFVMVHHTKVL